MERFLGGFFGGDLFPSVDHRFAAGRGLADGPFHAAGAEPAEMPFFPGVVHLGFAIDFRAVFVKGISVDTAGARTVDEPAQELPIAVRKDVAFAGPITDFERAFSQFGSRWRR